MPKLKQSQGQIDDAAYSRAIAMALAVSGTTKAELGDLVGVSRKTIGVYIAHPDQMRIADLRIVRDFVRRQGVEWPVTI